MISLRKNAVGNRAASALQQMNIKTSSETFAILRGKQKGISVIEFKHWIINRIWILSAFGFFRHSSPSLARAFAVSARQAVELKFL
jgi:hypothetical protein